MKRSLRVTFATLVATAAFGGLAAPALATTQGGNSQGQNSNSQGQNSNSQGQNSNSQGQNANSQ